jgi:hypothetical protein
LATAAASLTARATLLKDNYFYESTSGSAAVEEATALTLTDGAPDLR